MSEANDISKNQIGVFEEKSRKVLERFKQVATAGVNEEDKELLASLEDVKGYWRDALRPALVAFSFEAVGGRPGGADQGGLIATLLGAGIGIHDDIIDKSSTKHFRKTILGLHGLDYAVLIGDLLIVKALTRIREIIYEDFEPKKISDVLKTYENFLIEICKAQFMEIRFRRNLDVELEDYQKFLKHSIAEMEICTRLGAILGNGSEKEIEVLADFGRGFGYMMRLFSDITDSLNIEGNLDQRLENESVPLPILYATKSSGEIFKRIGTTLQKPHITPEDVSYIPELCYKTKAFAYTYKIAEKNAKEIIQKLKILNRSTARNVLASMVEKSLKDIAEFSLVEIDQLPHVQHNCTSRLD
jgi:geranylgeranyl pyrophosphate synthase